MKKCTLSVSILALSMLSSVALASEDASPSLDAAVAKVIAAYQTTSAMTVDTTLTLKLDTEKINETFSTRFDAEGGLEITTPNFTFVADDGYVFVTISGLDNVVLRRPIGEGPAKTMASIFGTDEVVPWDVALRLQKAPADWISRMTFGLMPECSFTSVESGTMPGSDMPTTVLEITSSRGSGRLYTDPTSGVIHSLVASITNPSGPEELKTQLDIRIDTTLPSSLTPEITFDPKGRKIVESIEDMLPKEPEQAPALGVAPDFTAAQLDGLDVTLSSLRGRIVVLDFWATWCGPCRKGLPLVQEFADWAKEHHPDDIVVYAVNVWERGSTQSVIVQRVKDYWSQNDFTMPTLIAYGNMLTNNYKISSIPVTVVIDRGGDIAAMHRGYSSSLLDVLKAEAKRLVATEQ